MGDTNTKFTRKDRQCYMSDIKGRFNYCGKKYLNEG